MPFGGHIKQRYERNEYFDFCSFNKYSLGYILSVSGLLLFCFKELECTKHNVRQGITFFSSIHLSSLMLVAAVVKLVLNTDGKIIIQQWFSTSKLLALSVKDPVPLLISFSCRCN